MRLIPRRRPGSSISPVGDNFLLNPGSIARCALLLAAGVLSVAPLARAATVDIEGPAGAEVLIDGELRGVLPLSGPLELPHGQLMILEVRRQGYVTHTQQLLLRASTTAMTVSVEMLTLSRRTATVSSLLLAGTGQFYQARPTAGWIQMGLQVTAWGSALYGELLFQDRRDSYEQLDQQYREALAPSDIATIREERETAWNELEDARLWRNVSLGAVALLAAYSAFDAWRGHGRFYSTLETPSQSADGSLSAKAGLRWNFGEGAR